MEENTAQGVHLEGSYVTVRIWPPLEQPLNQITMLMENTLRKEFGAEACLEWGTMKTSFENYLWVGIK